MSELSRDKVVVWLRAKAAEFNRTADMLECRLGGVASASIIRDKVSEHSWRVKELAANLMVPEAEIDAIVNDPANGFVLNGKGWIFNGPPPSNA